MFWKMWEEAFGRVVIEAYLNGIPVIASNTGGLPETIGKGGFCIEVQKYQDGKIETDPDISQWKELITRLDNNSFYTEISQKSFKEANDYYRKFEQGFDELIKYLKNLTV